MCPIPAKQPDILADLADVSSREVARELELDQAQATELGQKIAQAFCKFYAGEQIYIPVQHALKISERDQEVYAEFDGDNHRELSKKYGLSERTI